MDSADLGDLLVKLVHGIVQALLGLLGRIIHALPRVLRQGIRLVAGIASQILSSLANIVGCRLSLFLGLFAASAQAALDFVV